MECSLGWMIGPFQQLPAGASIVTPLACVPKAGGKVRVICDYLARDAPDAVSVNDTIADCDATMT